MKTSMKTINKLNRILFSVFFFFFFFLTSCKINWAGNVADLNNIDRLATLSV